MVAATVKVTGNRNTAETFRNNIDFDVSPVIETGEPLREAGQRLCELIPPAAPS